jgi:hypothetical protein
MVPTAVMTAAVMGNATAMAVDNAVVDTEVVMACMGGKARATIAAATVAAT